MYVYYDQPERKKKMSSPERRFEVGIKLEIMAVENGSPVPFCTSEVNYHNMKEDGVLAVEAIMVKTLGMLNELGFEKADGDMSELKKMLEKVK